MSTRLVLTLAGVSTSRKTEFLESQLAAHYTTENAYKADVSGHLVDILTRATGMWENQLKDGNSGKSARYSKKYKIDLYS